MRSNWHFAFLWPVTMAFAGAGVVALGVAAVNAFGHPSVSLWLGGLCQVMLFGGLVGLALQHRFFQHPSVWILLLLVVTTGSRVFLLVQFPNYCLISDHRYLYDFAEQMARGGLTRDNLAALNHNYDWANFLPRSLALPLPVSLLFPAHHLLVYHIALVVLAAGSLFCLGYLSYRLLPVRASRLALALYAAAPLRLWEVLGYPVDPLREFILLLGLVLLFRLFHSGGRTPMRIVTACGLALVMFLGHLQQGIDVFLMASLAFLGIGTLVLVPYELNQSFLGKDYVHNLNRNRNLLWSAWRRSPLVYLLLAAAIYLYSAKTYDRWQNSMDIRGWGPSLGATAYIATGFNLNKIGEFESHIWATAVEAPPVLKRPMMLAHVWSNIAYQPLRVFTVLFPVKAVKLCLVGYGSGIEQSLSEGGYGAASEFFKGMRLAYTPLFICALLAGGWWLLQRRIPSLWHALALCVLPFLSFLLFVGVGEVQSRYSYYTFFALCLIAGGAVAQDAFPRIPRPSRSGVIRHVLLAVGLYIAFASLTYGITRLFMVNSTFLDVRPAVTRASWESVGPSDSNPLGSPILYRPRMAGSKSVQASLEAGGPPPVDGLCDGVVPSGYRPYLRHIVLPPRAYSTNDLIRSELRSDRHVTGAVRMSAMLWPGDTQVQASAFRCTVRYGGEAVYEGPLISKPLCITSGWLETTGAGEIPPVAVEIECVREVPLKLAKPHVALRWGFVYIERKARLQ